MFFSSQRVRSSSEPAGRTETLASTAQRSLLHACVGDAERDDRLAKELEEALGLLGRADVGLGDDLDQRRAAPVEVDQRPLRADLAARAAADVDGLRRVLLQVRADEADLERLGAPVPRVARRRRAAGRTGRSGSPSGCPDRSSSSARRPPCSAISEPSARPSLIVHSTAVRFATGNAPGCARQTGQVCVFGSAPKPVSQRQNIFVRVFRWTWISSPTTASQSVTASSLISASPGRNRTPAPAPARGLPGRACSPRAAARPAAGRPAGPSESPHGIESPGSPATHDGNRQQVGGVHRERVVGALADRERDRRRRRRHDQVEALEDGGVLADDHRPHLLRLAVERVVVAGRERVRARA